MDWLAAIVLILRFVDRASRWLAERRLIDAAQAAAALRATEKAREAVDAARHAADAAYRAPLDADGDGVPDDDGFRRD